MGKMRNQTGSALMSVIVASLVIGGLSAVIMQQASQSQQYSRLARVKSAMFNAEAQLRSLAVEPSSYVGCDGQDPSTCKFNNAILESFKLPVRGAKCSADSPGDVCGVTIVPGSGEFKSGTREFSARLHYEGSELALRDIEIQNLVVPYETLARAAMSCPDTAPLFKGFQDGVPICEPLRNAVCPPNQWATRIDVNNLEVTCVPLPNTLSCPSGQYISSLRYDATGIHANCAPRADVYQFNSFTPNLRTNEPAQVAYSTPGISAPSTRTSTITQTSAGCYPELSRCETEHGSGNCVASSTLIYRAVSGSGGSTFYNQMCDVTWPGDLRGSSCTPVGSTRYVWDACQYNAKSEVDWNQPYMRTNYECQVKEYCPVPPPTTTTLPTTGVYCPADMEAGPCYTTGFSIGQSCSYPSSDVCIYNATGPHRVLECVPGASCPATTTTTTLPLCLADGGVSSRVCTYAETSAQPDEDCCSGMSQCYWGSGKYQAACRGVSLPTSTTTTTVPTTGCWAFDYFHDPSTTGSAPWSCAVDGACSPIGSIFTSTKCNGWGPPNMADVRCIADPGLPRGQDGACVLPLNSVPTTTTTTTTTLPPTTTTAVARDGVCPTRPLTLGCAVYNGSTRVTPVELGDYIGVAFTTGQYVRCEFGYADVLDADGFPSNLTGDDVRLLKQVRGGCDQWSYSNPEDCGAYLSVWTRKADNTRGVRCWGESKSTFNYEGK